MFDNDFERVFKNNIKISTRSITVRTLLSDRNIKRINYKPYYQRNYVWDAVKGTFFIESILLGTDIPPLILFKSGKTVEVIDGRQRFETLKRFKENSLKLAANGLMALKVLKGKSFNDLQVDIIETLLDTKVRLFEFEVINEPQLAQNIEDKIKKEIFRRYNTGITALNSTELDNAKYDKDILTEIIENDIESDILFEGKVTKCFFSNKKSKSDNSYLIDFFRRYIVLSNFPITSYAGSGSRTEIRELLYDVTISNSDDHKSVYTNFKEIVLEVINIHELLSEEISLDNKLIYECMLWAFSVLYKENVNFKNKINEEVIRSLREHYSKNIYKYAPSDSHYYGNILERFNDTASIFSSLFSCDFSLYIKDEKFSQTIKALKQTEEEGLMKIEVLNNLRVLKPEPSSVPIEEIINDLNTNKYLLRPSYQRQEKINTRKASSIIESILLGIYLPPIFVYKNKDSIKEIIDGQQRLLSILGFMGKKYKDEKGESQYSKNNNFSLSNLKILKEFNGKKFDALPENFIEKIYDFDINIIEIDYKVNEEFDPIDLFIRLNNKPYPIKDNSFEMWNSTVNYEIIKIIKDITNESLSWFYLRLTNSERTSDRMENEEMIAVLSYLHHIENHGESASGVEFYLKQDRLNCRISNKSAITNMLQSLDENINKKNEFLISVGEIKGFIERLKCIISLNGQVDDLNLAATFNDFLNVKNVTGFKRTLQDIYLLWMVLNEIPYKKIKSSYKEIYSDLIDLIKVMKNVNNNKVNNDFLDKFMLKVNSVKGKYK
ncbi:DUF262 domain-containing protein [Pectobacterium carotovorum]|uniref:DUF262 domain-containing protein n=1 Tax=Pectobacterium carotovorum TaxID=554 RepID=UPI001EFAE817|nr:DUF262 domain-containing protein [Pectobacterium carotovorum]ULS48952.1 DUF262 domain-containing protein [Pectobacterium carotovorum]GKW09104.1 hypothetical protein PEC301889_35860 [Pectobacterium carotovorum subsp. carotovorum]